jgi:fatty-acyl-CoA synthase
MLATQYKPGPLIAGRGETVKAVVALKDGFAGTVSEQDIVDWAQQNMRRTKARGASNFAAACPSRRPER